MQRFSVTTPNGSHARNSISPLRRDNHVVPLPFASQEVLSKQQFVARNVTAPIRLADVVDVNAAAFNVLAGLASRGT
jgi:hypothetical protein